MTDIVQFHRDGGLLDIVLSDPDGGNLISNAEGDRIVAELADSDGLQLVRLRSTGQTFCLGRVSPTPTPGTPGITGQHLKSVVAEPAIRVYTALSAVPVPVLSVVRGAAEGYGFGLVAASDIARAGDGARFSIPEMARNIPPTLVMTSLLGRASAKVVAHLVFSQQTIDARQAAELGIVSRSVADADIDADMTTLTDQILSYRPEAVRAIKEFLRFADGRDRAAAGSFAANLAASALSARFGG